MVSWRGLIAVAVCLLPVALFAVFGGCDAEVAGPIGNGGDDPPQLPPKPLFDGWNKPLVAVVFSGQQRGYLEPCGCSETQSGGVARRANLLKQIRDRGWPVAAFDLGGTIARDRQQSRIKFATVLGALKDMQYSAIGLGPEELRLGADYLLSQNVRDVDAPQSGLTFLGANVTFFGVPDLDDGPAKAKIVTVGETKIGVAAVYVEDPRNPLFAAGASTDVTIRPPAEAIPEALAVLQKESPRLLVLLSYATLEESRRLAERHPQFDVVFSAGPEEPFPEPVRVGKTWVVTVGHKGKHVGVLGVYPPGSEPPLRWELVDLDQQRFDEAPSMRERMREYQNRLMQEKVAAVEQPIGHPLQADFVGAAKCGECHTKAYSKWSQTPHAHAYESLIKGRKGQEAHWIPRNFDPECLACHVTGWDPQQFLRYRTGFVNEEFVTDPAEQEHVRRLKGQQCENCHGPGSRHVQVEEDYKRDRKLVEEALLRSARKEMNLTVAVAEKDVCRRCHDLDNSPKFDFAKYWEKVRHPWRD